MLNCVEFCKALGDETRQRILQLLMRRGDMCVSDLVNSFHLSQPTISHHLSLLKNAGLITGRREGKQVMYSADQGKVIVCCGKLFLLFTPEGANLSEAISLAEDSEA